MPALDKALYQASCYTICLTLTFFFVLTLVMVALVFVLIYLKKCRR